MEATRNNTLGLKQGLTISLSILIAIVLLFSIDKGTHSFFDLLKPGNLVALSLYFIPTTLISLGLYTLFSRRMNRGNAIALSLFLGIPLSFALIIGVFVFAGHKLIG